MNVKTSLSFYTDGWPAMQMRTQVAIVGGGPAGLLLSHILDLQGVDSIVFERQSRAHVSANSRRRAGIRN